MGSRNIKILLIVTTLSDLASVVLAWILAFILRFYSLIPVSKGIPDTVMYLKMIPFLIMTWFVVFSFSGLYRRLGGYRSAFIEGMDVLQNCIYATLAFVSISFFYDEYRYSRLTLLFFALLHPFAILTGRSLIRKAVRYYRKSSNGRRVLLIGSGELLEKAMVVIGKNYLEKISVSQVILVDQDDKGKKEGLDFCQKHQLKFHQIPDNWADFLTEYPCESVMIAVPYHRYDFLDKHMESIAGQVTDIKILPDLFKFTRFAAGVDMVDRTPVISIHESPLVGSSVLIKRILDIAGALVAISLFSPLMLLITAIVRMSSKGPVLYKQQRMGLDGKVFSILKFRSMPIDSESGSGAVWATSSDNRATPFGSLLRKSSLDELPQLFNVLKGEMSLVGPRPERPVFVNKFRHDVPGYMLRHKVKAGMTGWAQINGWRGNTSIDKRIEFDLYYIQNWSVWMDIKILFLTVFRGFVDPNAY